MYQVPLIARETMLNGVAEPNEVPENEALIDGLTGVPVNVAIKPGCIGLPVKVDDDTVMPVVLLVVVAPVVPSCVA